MSNCISAGLITPDLSFFGSKIRKSWGFGDRRGTDGICLRNYEILLVLGINSTPFELVLERWRT